MTLLNYTARNSGAFVSLTNLLKRKLLSSKHRGSLNREKLLLTQGLNFRQKLSSEVKDRSKHLISKQKGEEEARSLAIPNESSLQSMINFVKDLKLTTKPLLTGNLKEKRMRFGEKMSQKELARCLKTCNRTDSNLLCKLNDSALEQTAPNIKLGKKLKKNSTYRISSNCSLLSTLKREINRRSSENTSNANSYLKNLEKKSVRNVELTRGVNLMEEITECEGVIESEDLSVQSVNASQADLSKVRRKARVLEEEELFLFPLLKSRAIVPPIKLAVHDMNFI
eukprot:TRINITY_DN5988_c0_g4_i2.p1 TRINITY_DN5988_c0_g4~~TRINITY_DN5988_c0_g4_i2.p1  ORF type:complete len:282 (-),score=59.59 TRINITY_DN5988_c0_g4_i2:839-1684(-)